MRLTKALAMITVFTFALAIQFCFTECAFARPAVVQECQGHCQKDEPQPNDPSGCCQTFLALHKTPAQSIFAGQTILFHAVSVPFEFSAAISKIQSGFNAPSELSPPRVFLLAHAIHAPPAHA